MELIQRVSSEAFVKRSNLNEDLLQVLNLVSSIELFSYSFEKYGLSFSIKIITLLVKLSLLLIYQKDYPKPIL